MKQTIYIWGCYPVEVDKQNHEKKLHAGHVAALCDRFRENGWEIYRVDANPDGGRVENTIEEDDNNYRYERIPQKKDGER